MDQFAKNEKRVSFELIATIWRDDLLKGIIDTCEVNQSDAAADLIRKICSDLGARSLDKWMKNRGGGAGVAKKRG